MFQALFYISNPNLKLVIFQSDGFQSVTGELWPIPMTLSWGLCGHNYFHKNTKMLFALFKLSLSHKYIQSSHGYMMYDMMIEM